MRTLFTLLALVNLAGAARLMLHGDYRTGTVCLGLAFFLGGWAVAMHVARASRVMDEILDGKDPRTEDRRDKS